jgi:hypothetical protein
MWVFTVLCAIGFTIYLVLSGRLKWVEYQTAFGKVGLNVATTLGIKNMTPDEIIAFESFVYRDLKNLERGVRLAYVLLFIEKELLQAHFINNSLIIELTDKGKQLHLNIIQECEKKLMISPESDIEWKSGQKKIVTQPEKTNSLTKS